MRRDPYRVATETDIDALRFEALAQVRRQFSTGAQADQMADTPLTRDGIESHAVRPLFDMRCQLAQGCGNFLDTPRQQLPQGCDGDGHQREVGALAHVIAPRARLEAVAVVDESVEVFALLARDPVGFERHTFPPAGSDIDEPQAIRA